MCVLSHFRTCDVCAEVRAERFLELCVRCACVWLVLGRAMWDCTFAHFFEEKDKISCFSTDFPALKCPFPAFEHSNLEHPAPISSRALSSTKEDPSLFQFIKTWQNLEKKK